MSTGYLDPLGRVTSPIPAAPISPAPRHYAPVVHRKRKRLSPMWTALVALVVGLALAVPVVLLAADRQGIAIIPVTPSVADAKAACKSAIELEAQGRLKRATEDAGDTAIPSLAGVDIAEPVRTTSGYTVDGTIRFSILSIFGQIPGSVYVTCDAAISGSKLTTSVRNR